MEPLLYPLSDEQSTIIRAGTGSQFRDGSASEYFRTLAVPSNPECRFAAATIIATCVKHPVLF